MMMILIRMTFVTVVDDNNGAVDNGFNYLFVCLFSNLFIIIILLKCIFQ